MHSHVDVRNLNQFPSTLPETAAESYIRDNFLHRLIVLFSGSDVFQ